MKKVWFVLVALVILCGLFITTGEAGQLCWQVDSTNNVFDGYVSLKASGGKVSRALHGVYSMSVFDVPVSGNMIKSRDGNNWFLQVGTVFAGDHYNIGATLNNSTLSGSATMLSVGATYASYNMTFTSISCSDIPTP